MNGPKVRRELIRIKIQEIREGIRLVQTHIPETYEEFSRLGLLKDGIYRRTGYAIETVLDICAILNADLKLGVPGEDEDILEQLTWNEIISPEMAARVRGMKAFRNIVVHRYGTIDDKVAYNLLCARTGDFELFCRNVEAFLSGRG